MIEPQKHAKTIRGILDRFATGPAFWSGPVAEQAPASEATTAPRPNTQPATIVNEPVAEPASAEPASIEEFDPEVSARRLPPRTPTPIAANNDSRAKATAPVALDTPSDVTSLPEADLDETDPIASDDAAPEADGSERRRETRIPYERRIVALGEKAARVLVGRDLSQGGMRIAANDAVDLGDVLRVALHCGTELEPVVVMAKA